MSEQYHSTEKEARKKSRRPVGTLLAAIQAKDERGLERTGSRDFRKLLDSEYILKIEFQHMV